jgi:3-hydroxyisobutyrate dehydrogenase-like beta-hydroxyacid dehydrogenase
MTRQTVGFIGTGLMGHGMAKNIVEKGYPLHVLAHRNRQPIEDLIGRGAEEAASASDLARTCGVIFVCVTGSPQVEAIVRGPDGIKAGAREGMIVVDTSTSDPTSTLALADELAALGVRLVDAPLSRTPKEAWEGTLDTMVGADPDTFAAIKPVLETWAAKIVHVGPVGAGHKLKLLNNFIAMGYGALYSEALALGQKAGIAPETFHAIISGGRMDCGFYQTFMRYVIEGDRNAHRFTLRNAHKDMRYLASMALAAGMANPVGGAVKDFYAIAEAQGRGDDYVPMLSDIVAALNGTVLARPAGKVEA